MRLRERERVGVSALMGQQLRRAVGRIKQVERSPSSTSRVSVDRRSLPKDDLSSGKSPSTAAVDGVSGKNPKTLF